MSKSLDNNNTKGKKRIPLCSELNGTVMPDVIGPAGHQPGAKN